MPSAVTRAASDCAVGLALARMQVRVGRADDDVQGVRMRGDDRGQRLDRELVALARAEQAEAQDDVAAVDAEAGLTVAESTSGTSGTPCGMTSTRRGSTP